MFWVRSWSWFRWGGELIEFVGATLWLLPPTSPHLDPIEPAWAECRAFLQATSPGAVEGLDNIRAWFKHCNDTDITFSSGGVSTTAGWGGAHGGVPAFRASGSLTIESSGRLTVDGLGYAGGDTGRAISCAAFQGESYAGVGDGEGDSSCMDHNEADGHWIYSEGGGGAHVTGGGGNHAGGATDGAAWDGSATPP